MHFLIRKYATRLLLLLGLQVCAQDFIETPKVNSEMLGDITKIEFTEDATVFSFTKNSKTDGELLIPKTTYFETELDTLKHFVTTSESIDLDVNTALIKNEALHYKLYFPPIEESAKGIQLFYEQDLIKTTWLVQGQAQYKNIYLTPYIEITQNTKQSKTNEIYSNKPFDKVLLEAKKENKNVFLYFTAGWCGPCKLMDKYVFSHKEVQTAMHSNVIAIKVDVGSFKGEKLASSYNAKGIPHFYILNAEGAILKESVGMMKKAEFLSFLRVNDTIVPKQAAKNNATRKYKGYDLGLRIGAVNNTLDSQSRTGFTASLLFGIDYNGRYLLRSGVGFASKGMEGMAIDYLKIPVEFGWSVYKGTLFSLPGAVLLIGAPYYALRLGDSGKGISKDDYGMRFGIAPRIGSNINKLELEIYYEYGMNDVLTNVGGKQNNTSFGISLGLMF